MITPAGAGLSLAAFDLADHNTRVVLAGATVLGAVAGFVGTFLLLRGRALIADPVGHATLPGIVVAYMLQVRAGGDGRAMGGLLLGAFCSAGLGAALLSWLSGRRRAREDASYGVVLSLFYGGGVALMGIAQQLEAGRFSGVAGLLEGLASEMVAQDVVWVCALAAVSFSLLLVVHKELVALCFDPGFARAVRLPARGLDLLLMLVTTLVVVAGLQIVGLVLVMALLIIPPAAARYWCQRPGRHVVLGAVFGASSAIVGTVVSASAPQLPTGPLVVLSAASLFLVSLVFGTSRGLLRRRAVPRASAVAR